MAKSALVDAELAEADALQVWLDLQPKVDPNKLSARLRRPRHCRRVSALRVFPPKALKCERIAD